MTTPEIDRCARAIAEVRERYDIMLGYKCRVIDKGNPNWPKVFSGDEDECQHWIDCQAAIACREAFLPLKRLEDWHEDDGNCLWFKFPIDEPPYVGTPNDSDWLHGYYTHWMPLDGIAELAMSSTAAIRAITREE